MKISKIPFITTFMIFMLSLTGCGGIDITPDLNVDVSNHDDITLKAYFPNFGCSNQKVERGWLAKEIIRQTGYNVNFKQFSPSMDTEVNKFLNTQEPIDMMKVGGTMFNNYVTLGYYTDLTDVIEKYANIVVKPDGTTFKNLFTEEQWEACSYNGRIYAIPEIGHTLMADQALVWNTDHLKAVGITKIPETISEINDAFYALQEHFGPQNRNYFAFNLYRTIPVNNPLGAAFDVPAEWYVDDNGNLQNVVHSTQFENYMKWTNTLLNDGIIPVDWVSHLETDAMNNFVRQNTSCYVAAYWNITPVRDMLINSYTGFPSDVVLKTDKEAYVYGEIERATYKNDALLGWNVFAKGDGTHGSLVQEKTKVREGPTGVGYYITVPVACAKRAAYVVDWVCKKNTEAMTITLIAGEENTHYEYVNKDDPDAIKLNTPEEKYVKINDRFLADISGMSQFQTSVNNDIARQWWPVAEAGFNAWNVLVVDENGQEDRTRVVENPFKLHPVLPNFAKVDVEAQNYVITQAQALINAEPGSLMDDLAATRRAYNTRYYDKCKDEINTWFKQNNQ